MSMAEFKGKVKNIHQQGGNRSRGCLDGCYRSGHIGRVGRCLLLGFPSVRSLHGAKTTGGGASVFPSPLAVLRCIDFPLAASVF